MNLRKSGRMLVLVAAVAMLALVLQGCGGDGGVSQGRFDEAVAKTAAEEKAAEEARKKAEAEAKAKMEAEAARKKAEADKTSAETARKKAEADRTMAEADKTSAQEKATAAATDKATAEERATTAEAAKKVAEDKAKELQDKVDAAQKAVDSAQAERDRLAMRAASIRREKTGNHTNDEIAAQRMNRRVAGQELKLTSSTLKAEFPGYEQDDTMRPDAIAGWAGATLVKTATANKEDKIVVYTNQAEKKVLLSTLYAGSVFGGKTSYNISEDGSAKTFKWGHATAPTAATSNAKGDPGEQIRTSGTTNTLTGKVLGTVPGTFTCSGAKGTASNAACRYIAIGAGAARIVIPFSTSWTFTPTDNNAMIDGDYLFFGWWRDTTTPRPNGSFGVFYNHRGQAARRTGKTDNSTTGTLRANGTDLKGVATYTGPAAGRYAIRSLTVKNGNESGTFTARAQLTLDFDDDVYSTTAAIDVHGISLTGMIDQFKGEYAGIGKWKVKLTADGEGGHADVAGIQPLRWLGYTGGDTAAPATNGTANSARNLAEWSLDGTTYTSATETVANETGPQPAGRFTANFYGGAATAAPEMAVGMFHTSITSLAELSGAFAVTKD